MTKKLSLLVILIFSCLNATACDKPISFQAGPFFSSSLIIKFWQPFTQSIEMLSKCQTLIKNTPTYDDYLKSILNKTNDIYAVPDHYISALKELGYKAILSSEKTGQIYFASKFPIENGDLTKLYDTTITVPSIYTRTYLELKDWLIKNNAFDKVSFDFNHSHDSAALLLIKGERSSTVILASIYDKLPKYIKKKMFVHKLQASAGAYIMVKEGVNQTVIDAMIQSLDKLGFQKWHANKDTSEQNEPFSDVFKAQLESFKRTQMPSNNHTPAN